MKKLTLLMIAGVLSMAVYAQDSDAFKVIEPQQFEQAVKSNQKVLIDVRTREEYDDGHIPHAGNIDFYGDDFKSKMDYIDRNKPLYIYCKSGHRSSMASQMLKGMGFKNVVELKGGYLAWKGKLEK